MALGYPVSSIPGHPAKMGRVGFGAPLFHLLYCAEDDQPNKTYGVTGTIAGRHKRSVNSICRYVFDTMMGGCFGWDRLPARLCQRKQAAFFGIQRILAEVLVCGGSTTLRRPMVVNTLVHRRASPLCRCERLHLEKSDAHMTYFDQWFTPLTHFRRWSLECSHCM